MNADYYTIHQCTYKNVCVCVCERERERERGGGRGGKHTIMAYCYAADWLADPSSGLVLSIAV